MVHAVAGAAGGMVAMRVSSYRCRAHACRASTYPLVSLSVRAQVETKKGDDSTLEAAKKVIQVRFAPSGSSSLWGSGMASVGYTTACHRRLAATP